MPAPIKSAETATRIRDPNSARLNGERLAEVPQLADRAEKLYAAAEEWVATHASEGKSDGGAVAE